MEFFPHIDVMMTIDVMMAKSTIHLPDQDTQGIPEVNTFLNLFIHWLQNFKYNFTLPLENLFFLYYQNWTTTILINYYEVFLLGCCYFVKVQPLFLAWIGLSPHQKPLGIISIAHHWVSAWLPHISFRCINFLLKKHHVREYYIRGLRKQGDGCTSNLAVNENNRILQEYDNYVSFFSHKKLVSL